MTKELWIEATAGEGAANAPYYYNANTLKVSPHPPRPEVGVVVFNEDLMRA